MKNKYGSAIAAAFAAAVLSAQALPAAAQVPINFERGISLPAIVRGMNEAPRPPAVPAPQPAFVLEPWSEKSQARPAMAPADRIAAYIKEVMRNTDEREMAALIRHQYARMFLMDDRGEFVSDTLKKYSSELMPARLAQEDVAAFIDIMARNTKDNPAITSFLEAASMEDLGEFGRRVRAEGAEVLPKSVAIAYVYEYLTVAQMNHLDLEKEVMRVFKEVREKNGISFRSIVTSPSGLFEWAKMVTVEMPNEIFIASRERGQVLDPEFGRFLLPINEGEAWIADHYLGHHDNAHAAWVLMMNAPGRAVNADIDGGNTELVNDRFLIHLPLGKPGVDLYHSWNMAFIAQLDSTPYLLPKLLVPSVSGYKNAPPEYMYARAIALYAFLQQSLLGELYDKQHGVSSAVQWGIGDKLSGIWGKINRDFADCYQNDVCKAKARRRGGNN